MMVMQRRRKAPPHIVEAAAVVRDIEVGIGQHCHNCPQCHRNRARPELWCDDGYHLAVNLKRAQAHLAEMRADLAAGQGSLF